MARAGTDESGLIAHQRMIRPKAGGKYTLKTTRGQVKYDYFTWDEREPVSPVPYDQFMVVGNFRFEGSGMIQFGKINLKALLEAADGMPFAYTGHYNRMVEFIGPRDAIRHGSIYKAAEYPTWGVHYTWKAYTHAREQEECGGFMWPTEEIAREQIVIFEQTGEKPQCWNLPTLRKLFPDHPVIAEVEKIELRKSAQGR